MSISPAGIRNACHAKLLHRHFWWVIIGGAMLLRMGWLFLFHPEPQADFNDYYHLALSLANGEGYIDHGVATAYRPVGYPAFLGSLMALFGDSLWVGKIANVVLAIGVIFFGYQVAKHLFRSELAGRWTAILLTIHPNQVAFSSLLSAEILFLALLLSGVWIMLRATTPSQKSRQWVLFLMAGAVLGFATYVKPQAIGVPAIAMGVVLFHQGIRGSLRKGIVWGILVYLGLSLVLAPWWVRNQIEMGGFVLVSTHGGTNLFIGNNPFATGKYAWAGEVQSLAEAGISSEMNERERDQAIGKAARKYIWDHPGNTFRLIPKKLSYTYKRDTDGFDWVREGVGGLTGFRHHLMRGLKFSGAAYYLLLWMAFLWAILGFIRSKKENVSPLAHLGWGLIIYFTLIYMLFFGDPRFHFPVLPWMMMYVGWRLSTSYSLPKS